MKKVVLGICYIFLCVVLSGCMSRRDRIGDWITTDQKTSDKIVHEIARALNTNDKEALKDMFAKTALKETKKDLDQQIDSFFEFYHGNVVSYEGNCSSHSTIHGGIEATEFSGRYTLTTNKEQYRIKYEYKPVDDLKPGKEGLYQVEIVTEEEYDYAVKADGYYHWNSTDQGPGVYVPRAQDKEGE